MGGGYTGIIYENGERFVVPKTKNTLQEVFLPWNWNLMSLVNVTCYLSVIATYFLDLPLLFYIVQFFFWRFAYNLGVGYLLKLQSERETITRFTKRIIEGDTWISLFFRVILFPSSLSSDPELCAAPAAFHAWKFFRKVVDLILDCDFVAYLVLGYKIIYHYTSYRYDLSDALVLNNNTLFYVGIAINTFSTISKIDAHVRIGDYSWYYGDFFFKSERDLIFNGVFSMFPHPMYTAGYIWYYGSVCISRSLLLFYISLIAHVMQLFFLKFVEDPHIRIVYGEIISDEEKERKAKLYDKENGYFSKDLILFWNFLVFRSTDISTAALVGYNLLLLIVDLPQSFYYCHAIFWRMFHSGFLGLLLFLQSKRCFLSKYNIKNGRSVRETFEDWKRLYNISITLTLVSFLICAVKFFEMPEEITLQSMLGFKRLTGLIMAIFSLWSTFSSYKELGDYGFFYGDFFISDAAPSGPTYSGVYRYLDNPDLIAGFLGFYGISMITSSIPMAILTLFSQASHYAFLRLVELPHMESLYGEQLRERSGIRDGLGVIASGVRKKAASSIGKMIPSPRGVGRVD